MGTSRGLNRVSGMNMGERILTGCFGKVNGEVGGECRSRREGGGWLECWVGVWGD